MKIEVGMYVRTNNGIFKIYCIAPKEENYYKLILEQNEKLSIGDSELISKASHNIIDLIEVGDVISFYEDIDNYKKEYVIGIVDNLFLDEIKDKILNGNIRLISIVTKEQFEQMSYKVN